MCWPVDITGSAGSFTPLAQAKIFLSACASVSMHDTVACVLTFLFWCVSPRAHECCVNYGGEVCAGVI